MRSDYQNVFLDTYTLLADNLTDLGQFQLADTVLGLRKAYELAIHDIEQYVGIAVRSQKVAENALKSISQIAHSGLARVADDQPEQAGPHK